MSQPPTALQIEETNSKIQAVVDEIGWDKDSGSRAELARLLEKRGIFTPLGKHWIHEANNSTDALKNWFANYMHDLVATPGEKKTRKKGAPSAPPAHHEPEQHQVTTELPTEQQATTDDYQLYTTPAPPPESPHQDALAELIRLYESGDITEVITWYKNTKGAEHPMEPQQTRRPVFKGETGNTGIKINKEIMAEAKAKLKTENSQVGKSFSALVEFLVWKYIGSPPELVSGE
jgi:hypothetical protein